MRIVFIVTPRVSLQLFFALFKHISMYTQFSIYREFFDRKINDNNLTNGTKIQVATTTKHNWSNFWFHFSNASLHVIV